MALTLNVCVKGLKNKVADSLSEVKSAGKIDQMGSLLLQEVACAEWLHKCAAKSTASRKSSAAPATPAAAEFPLDAHVIRREQFADDELMKLLETSDACLTRKVDGQELITQHGKVCVPKTSRMRIMDWRHHFSCHPGTVRMIETLQLHLKWPKLRQSHIKRHVRFCQTAKKQREKHHGGLPPKISEEASWRAVCADTVGLYEAQTSAGQHLAPLTMTMIDPGAMCYK